MAVARFQKQSFPNSTLNTPSTFYFCKKNYSPLKSHTYLYKMIVLLASKLVILVII